MYFDLVYITGTINNSNITNTSTNINLYNMIFNNVSSSVINWNTNNNKY